MSRRVLLVDDDVGFLGLATRLLTDWGYDVVGDAASVASGLAQAARLRPDIVVTDIALPDGNGFDLAAGLGSLPVTSTVVFVSADPQRPAAPAAGPARGPACGPACEHALLSKTDFSAASLARVLSER